MTKAELERDVERLKAVVEILLKLVKEQGIRMEYVPHYPYYLVPYYPLRDRESWPDRTWIYRTWESEAGGTTIYCDSLNASPDTGFISTVLSADWGDCSTDIVVNVNGVQSPFTEGETYDRDTEMPTRL